MNGKALAVLLIFGALFGLLLAGSDIANPITKSEEAWENRETAKISIQKDKFDLTQYIAEQTALHDATMERLKEETEYQRQRHAQDLQIAQQWSDLKLHLLSIGGYALSLSVLALRAYPNNW
jgi:hypothetical protein